MSTIGIVGGIGPESTLLYYRELCTRLHARLPEDAYPKILINSVNMSEMLSFVTQGDMPRLVDFLVDAVGVLERSGCDFAAIASNTPHMVFDEVRGRCKIPLVSIVEATAARAMSLGLSKVLLTGTGFTMKADFFPRVLARRGIEVIVPSIEEQDEIHAIIFPDLENGIVRPEKKERFHSICATLIKRHSLDGLILGCTELPLIASQSDYSTAVLDTAEIHIEALVLKALAGR